MEEKIHSHPAAPAPAEAEASLLTPAELQALPGQYRRLLRAARPLGVERAELLSLRQLLARAAEAGAYPRNQFGLSRLSLTLDTAATLCEMVSPDRNMLLALLLSDLCAARLLTEADTERRHGPDVARMVTGLLKVAGLYSRRAAVRSDNFRRLLMAFADDIRVIIIMTVSRLALMKRINHHPAERLVRDTAYEAGYLYAPLAHRLGLYAIKQELEDMSLKYTDRPAYTAIARGLRERKAERDAYIDAFITPVREKLRRAGLTFDIKGRTKSIYSIWNKLRRQKTDLDHIYDLFAIRIIIDTPPEREKSDCWLAYSLITDMYRPNPSRMKDWISIPKSNGYESLHITVAGPGGRWVEVQIRTRRMDLVAERGLAAHWRYKGIKSEGALDRWMTGIREILESAAGGDPMELVRDFRMDVYDKEVFAFTPRGDLFRLPAGATLLDFAFSVHSSLGSRCTGGRVNGKAEKLGYRLRSGDTVEIATSSQQAPKRDWLSMVVTSKARNKIRQALKEQENRRALAGREMLERRLKNRKITLDEASLSRLVKRLGYKTFTDFYTAVADGALDVSTVAESCTAAAASSDTPAGADAPAAGARHSAGEFRLQQPAPAGAGAQGQAGGDVLVIGDGVSGLSYRFARCCNPIYGDDVFGFISQEGVVKIHRADCPNARDIHRRYPYRVIPVRWSGKTGDQFAATLRVVGIDDIGIVTNITSVISKEKDASLRNIAIDSHDGLFQGHLTVGVASNSTLQALLRKIAAVKGVKGVDRVV